MCGTRLELGEVGLIVPESEVSSLLTLLLIYFLGFQTQLGGWGWSEDLELWEYLVPFLISSCFFF